MNRSARGRSVKRLDTDGNVLVISIHVIIAAWLNVSQRSRVGVGMNSYFTFDDYVV